MKCELLNESDVIYRYDTETKKAEILSPGLRDQLDRGINILPSERAQFHNKRLVKLDDPDFHQAFKDIYVPKLDQAVFHWRVTA